ILLQSFNGQFTNIAISGSGANGYFALALQGSYGFNSFLGGGINTWGPINLYTNVGSSFNSGLGNVPIGTISGMYVWHEQGRFIPSGTDFIIDPLYIITNSFGMYNMAGMRITARNGIIGSDNGSLYPALQLDSQ